VILTLPHRRDGWSSCSQEAAYDGEAVIDPTG
jgi:hypothetical protein